MKYGYCPMCKFMKNLTKHSEIGGHAEGTGYLYVCRDCHDLLHGIKDKRKNIRTQKGNSKFAKGTRRRK